jgi:hypothetical protein
MFDDDRTVMTKGDQATKGAPVAVSETSADEKKNDRVFFWFAGGSVSLAFGVLSATLASAHQSPSGFVFRAGGGAWVAFALGAAGGLLVWRIVSDTSPARASLVLRATLILLLLGGLATFLYPLRFLQTQTLIDVGYGLATGVVALTCLGLILWRIKRALDRDTTENETMITPPAANQPPARAGAASDHAPRGAGDGE